MALKLGPFDLPVGAPTCWRCRGDGTVRNKRVVGQPVRSSCPSCGGTGHAVARYARYWDREKASRFRLTSIDWTADTPEARTALRRLYRAVKGDE